MTISFPLTFFSRKVRARSVRAVWKPIQPVMSSFRSTEINSRSSMAINALKDMSIMTL